MLISGAGGQGFTSALLQGRQIGNQARALREQANQRRQQLALGIGGLGVGAIGALGGLAGTVGNLANQSARTGILQEELGLRKAEEAPVEGSLFGLPPGPVHPRLVQLHISKLAAEKDPYGNKITVPINFGRADDVTAAARKGLLSPEQQSQLTGEVVSAPLGAEEPELLRAIGAVTQLEERPTGEYGTKGAFDLDKMKAYKTEDMAEKYARLMADPTVQPNLKRTIAQEWQRRQELIGKPTGATPEEWSGLLPPKVEPLPSTPWVNRTWEAPAYAESETKRRERLRKALEWAMMQQRGYQGPLMP